MKITIKIKIKIKIMTKTKIRGRTEGQALFCGWWFSPRGF
jgi:hypothetical protein